MRSQVFGFTRNDDTPVVITRRRGNLYAQEGKGRPQKITRSQFLAYLGEAVIYDAKLTNGERCEGQWWQESESLSDILCSPMFPEDHPSAADAVPFLSFDFNTGERVELSIDREAGRFYKATRKTAKGKVGKRTKADVLDVVQTIQNGLACHASGDGGVDWDTGGMMELTHWLVEVIDQGE